MAQPTAQLAPFEVAVFHTRPDAVARDRVPALLGLLSEEERERHARFRFDQHRHEYLVAHVLLRTTLARYLGGAPAELRFRAAEHGKPELAERPAALRFNLSHTEGLVACAVAAHAEVGVDVEHEDRRIELWSLAKSVFSTHEQRVLRGLGEADQRRRFFEYWTLKESYIKAVGKGLSLPLRSITFHLEDAEPSIAFAPPLDDRPADWRFASLRASARHPLAVAVRCPEPLRLRVSESTL